MGIFSALFGHTKLRTPDKEQFFSIVGAAYNLEARTDFRSTHRAGVVVNPVESSYFDNLSSEIRTLLDLSGRSTGTRSGASRSDPPFPRLATVVDTPASERVKTCGSRIYPRTMSLSMVECGRLRRSAPLGGTPTPWAAEIAPL